jgi:L-fucono-1,5-lactonase
MMAPIVMTGPLPPYSGSVTPSREGDATVDSAAQPAFMVIDAHQHYWDVGQFDYGWTRQGLPALERDFLPSDLEPQLAAAGVQRTVLVQVLHTIDETRWMLDQAHGQDSIAGVVGWVDLTWAPESIEADLGELRRDRKLVGIRHLVHDEPDVDWLVRAEVLRGLGVLEAMDVPFDLLLRPPHLRHVPRLSERLPRLRMVVDHVAKPLIREAVLEPWASELAAAAENEHVWCKLSGMITEADHASWTPDDLAPYVESAMRSFGPGRLMFGSDWPVCTLAGSYQRVIDALRLVLRGVDAETEASIFGANARAFYRLDEPTITAI